MASGPSLRAMTIEVAKAHDNETAERATFSPTLRRDVLEELVSEIERANFRDARMASLGRAAIALPAATSAPAESPCASNSEACAMRTAVIGVFGTYLSRSQRYS